MKIEIQVAQDSSFQLITNENENIEEVQAPEPVESKNAAPIENPRQINSFDLFANTSWGGTLQRPTDIGR